MQKFTRLAALFTFIGFAFTAAAQDKKTLPDGPEKALVQRVCGSCHGAEIVVGRGLSRDGWEAVIVDMATRGADATEDEFGQVLNYLAKNFPPKTTGKKINVNKAAADELKTGLDLSAKDADAVVHYREQNGDFKSLDELKKVPGIDTAKIDAKKDLLAF